MGTKCGGAEGRGEGGPQPHVSVVLSYFLCLFSALVAEGMCSVRGSQAQIREDRSDLGSRYPSATLTWSNAALIRLIRSSASGSQASSSQE